MRIVPTLVFPSQQELRQALAAKELGSELSSDLAWVYADKSLDPTLAGFEFRVSVVLRTRKISPNTPEKIQRVVEALKACATLTNIVDQRNNV